MCESDDGQDDLMSRSTGMCESDQARIGTVPVVAEAAPAGSKSTEEIFLEMLPAHRDIAVIATDLDL